MTRIAVILYDISWEYIYIYNVLYVYIYIYILLAQFTCNYGIYVIYIGLYILYFVIIQKCNKIFQFQQTFPSLLAILPLP